MKYFARSFTTLILVFLATSAFGFTYTTNAKNARQNCVANTIDAGPAAGKLEIGPTGMGSVCLTITLNDPSAGAAASGILTLSGFPKTATASANCTAGEARIRDSNNNDVATGFTVGMTGSGANIILDNTNIVNGQSVTINSFVINHL